MNYQPFKLIQFVIINVQIKNLHYVLEVTKMKLKKEMLLPEAEPFTNACTNKELIGMVAGLYM